MFLSASVPSRPEHERTREAASMGQLGRPTLRKTQSNLDFSKQGVGGSREPPNPDFLQLKKNPDLMGRGQK